MPRGGGVYFWLTLFRHFDDDNGTDAGRRSLRVVLVNFDAFDFNFRKAATSKKMQLT